MKTMQQAVDEAGRKATAEDRYRRKYLPEQLIAARRRVDMLENEARGIGLTGLL